MVKDLRSFLADLEEADELLRVKKEVDPLTQMGVLFYRSPKALLFENIKGYPGWRVCGELFTTRKRQAIMLGTTPENVVPKLAEMLERKPTKCKLVSDGPVKEQKMMGDKVDLRKLPVLVHSEGDAGPYIGAGAVVSKDPETGIQNVAVLRLQVKSKNHTGILMIPRHTWKHFEMYEKMDKPMPVAVVIGHHPVYDLVATYCTSYGVDEYELAGPILGETVERVECETVDLEVPAHAEIVIEGEIPPHVREEEGPFGEFQGYYSGGMGMNPIIKVTAITMRHDAIYRHVEAGKPPSEHQTWAGLPLEAELYKRIKDVGGFIDVKDVHIPHYGGLFTAVAKITPHYEGEAKNVLLAMMSTSYLHPKVCIVVDDDVDIYDPADIMWAISTRVNPETDVIIIPRTRMHPLDISATQISPPGTRWQRLAAKIGIDATKPSTWAEKERELFKRVYPKGWGKYKLEDFL